MTNHLNRFTGALFLILGLLIAPSAFALEITGVEPTSAPQGVVGQVVHISGTGFDKSARITFYLDGDPAPQITVQSTNTLGSENIEAVIDITPDAPQGIYTLQVTQRRGGKGTTLKADWKSFEVTAGNKELYSCSDVFGLADDTACNCQFTRKQDGGTGTPGVALWVLQGDCETSTTLELPQFNAINGNEHWLTAIPVQGGTTFDGYSVIANAGHRTHVFRFNITVDGRVTNTGCDSESDLNSAIAFVLDGTSLHPEDPVNSVDLEGRTYPLTRLRSWGIIVDSAKPDARPFCTGIEFRREPGYFTDVLSQQPNPESYTDAVVLVSDVMIRSGSYTRTGIQVSGFINAEVGGRYAEKIGVQDSTVMPAADGTGESAVLFGPVYGPGTVGQNALTVNGGIGILVKGGDGFDDVIIENNDVAGADTAVRVAEDDDPQVLGDEIENVFFKSNILVGSGSASTNGIDTDAFKNRYRSNRISGFECSIRESGTCVDPIEP